MLNKIYFIWFLITPITLTFSQYTDQINSNRPGVSIGAFSVGTRVIQFESGIGYRNYKHKSYNNSISKGKIGFISLRYGLLKEQLEINYEGSYMIDKLQNYTITPGVEYKREGFLSNFIGVKYLFFDPFKKNNVINVYSWDANNKFKIKDLIPAASISIGTNVNFKKNKAYPFGDVFEILNKPFLYQTSVFPKKTEPFFTGRITLATQSHFFGTWVFVTNFTYDRILSNYIEKNYILTLTHTFDPKWSIYIETQGISSEIYKDQLFRSGIAYLMNDDLQFEMSFGFNSKNSPSSTLLNTGVSYRLDFHKDIDPQINKDEKNLKKQSKKEEKELKKAFKKSKKATRKARKNTKF